MPVLERLNSYGLVNLAGCVSTALLKKWNGRGGVFSSEPPRYAIIGPPGAGKTTALLTADLEFQHGAKMGTSTLHGVEATRSCEWLFSKQAVLIDTPGRYTTQDSHNAADRAAWYKFLERLRTTRPSQPLEGLIVAIALGDATSSQNSSAQAYARSIRQRVNELQTLGVIIPIYIAFTKVDLIAGFTEFFADLDSDERSQVWGMTFDLALDPSEYSKIFSKKFQELIQRLETFLFKRLQIEIDPQKRALISTFPSEVGSLEPALAVFLNALLGSANDDPALFLRGLYFTSATQEGTPIDPLADTVARTFGLPPPVLKVARTESRQSFFLKSLLHEVIFNKAQPISTTPTAARRQEIIRLASLAAAVFTVILVGGSLWHIWANRLQDINTSAAAVQAYEHATTALQTGRVADGNLALVAPLLDQARDLPFRNDEFAGAGHRLSQRAKLGAAAQVLYRHALERIMLPRLVWRLESQMRDSLNRPDSLYDATLVYLMLVGYGPVDKVFVHKWMELDWQTLYPGDKAERLRNSLLGHLDSLLADPLPPEQPDGDLVARARGALAQVSPAQRGYSRIRRSAAARQLAPWRPSEVLGPAGIPLFIRSSGEPISNGIDGFYTVDGFQNVLLPCLSAIAGIVAAESWIIQPRANANPGSSPIPAIERNIVWLYENDYARTWDGLLSDLNVVPLKSISQAAQDLYIQASPLSPMRTLLTSVAHQLTLSGSASIRRAGQDGATERTLRACPATDVIAVRPGPNSAKALPWSPGREIDDRYRGLRELVGSGPGAPIDGVLRSLNEMQQQFAKAAAASVGIGVLAGTTDPSPALRAEALKQPEPFARWLTTLASSGAALRDSGAKP